MCSILDCLPPRVTVTSSCALGESLVWKRLEVRVKVGRKPIGQVRPGLLTYWVSQQLHKHSVFQESGFLSLPTCPWETSAALPVGLCSVPRHCFTPQNCTASQLWPAQDVCDLGFLDPASLQCIASHSVLDCLTAVDSALHLVWEGGLSSVPVHSTSTLSYFTGSPSCSCLAICLSQLSSVLQNSTRSQGYMKG